MKQESELETWRSMVLRAMAPPAWLSADAPQGDVVLSTRWRVARNLRGFRFPHHASQEDLRSVMAQIKRALPQAEGFEFLDRLTHAERDYLVGCRLVSPEFPHRSAARAVIVDHGRNLSLMINEEDHVRLQAVSAGWSIRKAGSTAQELLHKIGSRLDFAHSERFGYLTASPYNAGHGLRQSAMLHLIGLAHTKQLSNVLKAVSARGISARGLFGEASRAVGAFLQFSITHPAEAEFVGACEYLIQAERKARSSIDPEVVGDRFSQIADYVNQSRTLTLADSLRVLGWARLASTMGLRKAESPRAVDEWLTGLEVRNSSDEEIASRQRADFLRKRLDMLT